MISGSETVPLSSVEALGLRVDALEEVAAAAAALTSCRMESEAVEAVAAAGGRALGADVSLVRLLDRARGHFVVRAVSTSSPALAAELEGLRLAAQDVAIDNGDSEVVGSLAPLADRLQARGALRAPIVVDGAVRAILELIRTSGPFSAAEEAAARVLAAQLGLALRRFDAEHAEREAGLPRQRIVELLGDALGAGASDDEAVAGREVARLVMRALEPLGVVLWRADGDGSLGLLAAAGAHYGESDVTTLRSMALRASAARQQAPAPESVALAEATVAVVHVRLGQGPAGVLQLVVSDPSRLPADEARALARMGARAGQALESRARSERTALDLEQARAVLTIVAEAIAQLSLAHTLETTIERISALLAIERVAIYLQERHGLESAAGRGVSGPHTRVAERLLELALGPFRGRGLVVVPDARRDGRTASLHRELAASGIDAALGVPLVARGEVVGLLAAYPPADRSLTPNEAALLRALAAQLAVAVQNARLHEQAKQLGEELEQVLAAERRASRELRALYEISRTFAQSLSLETTLEAIARAVVESFALDAAVIRMPDERGELLVTRAVHVADEALLEPVRSVLSRSQSIASSPVQRLLQTVEPVLLAPGSARSLDTSHSLLAPFLEQGSTAGVVPIATPSEVVGTLTLLSLDPARPLTPETIATAQSIARQAALAIDNARLYQQQKGFADTMQRSLMPRSRPSLSGLELGDVYESSARVDVGGDVYDYLILADGRLAVVVGDVTGHGIEATADMAMAKFVFRSLTREHPAPEDLLAAANDVLVGEIPVGKFVTMVYVAIDIPRGDFSCASAGHPPPRIVRADGRVEEVAASGMALGVEGGQSYAAVSGRLDPGDAIVLYTDGLIEARRNGEQYGVERLDELLSERHALPAQQLASAVVEDCRSFAGGELSDDTAVVVIRRTGVRGESPG